MNREVKPGLVSVVVASYNHAKFLTRRMDGLINQTYQDIEILVIDDCSPDNSAEILRRYESHPKVSLIIREKNGGWITVSNQGVEISTGEFIIFANCDDDCDPGMIERLVGVMKANPTAGIVFCRSQLVDEYDHIMGDDYDVRESGFRKKCETDALITGVEMRRFLLHSCVIPNLSAALFRKVCFSTVGKFSPDYRVCSDWDLFFRIAERYDVAYVAQPLNKFRQHSDTIRSITNGRVTYEEYFRLLLGQIKVLDLSFLERCRFRTRVMYLWGYSLFTQPWVGLRNFPYHLGKIIQFDPLALAFFLPGFMMGVFKINEKVFNWLRRSMSF